MTSQYSQVVNAIDAMLEQLRRGPKLREESETVSAYARRCEVWYDTKYRFCLFGIKCLKQMDKGRAEVFLNDLRQLKDCI